MVVTGTLGSAVLNAKWDDIDLADGSWKLPSPKSGRSQTVPLSPNTVAILTNTPHTELYLVPGQNPKTRAATLVTLGDH